MKENFNDRLQYLLESRFGGNRASLSRSTDIKPATLASYLSGETHPRVPEIEKISQACGVSIHWLFTGEDLPAWVGAVAESGGRYKTGEKRRYSPFLTQIIGWINEVFGENSPQAVILYNDLLLRYQSFSKYVSRTTPAPGAPDNKKEDWCQEGGG